MFTDNIFALQPVSLCDSLHHTLFFFLFFGLCLGACVTLVPRPGITPIMEAQSLNH